MADNILVLGDDARAFLAVARSLGRRGIEVHAAPSDMAAPALRSRYICQIHSLPSYAAGPETWARRLGQIVQDHSIAMVVPCSDSSLAKLHHCAGRIGDTQLAIPGSTAMAAFTDKAATRALAASLGVPVATGEVLESGADASELSARIGLPMAIKPCVSYILGDVVEKRFARIVKTLDELRTVLAAHAGKGFLAESFFVGEGVGVSVVARAGTIVQAYQHRRLHEASETGASTSRISEPVDPELLRSVEAMTRATELHGIAMFEFRREPITGNHVLLEVNPRFWGSLPLAIEAGVDFPAMLHDLLTRRPVSPVRDYRVGLVKRDLLGEYYRISGLAERTRSLGLTVALAAAAIRLVTPRAWDSWAADDPQPFIEERRELGRRIGEALRKRLPSTSRRLRQSPLT
jgi:predicted ATP-grasp superfamily ATP-dependent carboligase